MRRLGLGLALGLALALGWGQGALAQTACSTQNTASLLGQFSDNAGAGSITPQNVRNVICSGQQLLSPGAVPLGQSPTTSPFSFSAAQAGVLVVSSGEVQITRNSTTVVMSVTGGSFTLSASDQVTVSWTGSGSWSIPVVTWLPNGT